MRRSLSAIGAAALALAGCAELPPARGDHGIARLTPEALAQALPAPEPALTSADLVALSRAGMPAAAIIARLQKTQTRLALRLSEALALHGQGVSAEVLDYLQAAHEQRLRESAADLLNQSEQRYAQALRREHELARSGLYCDPWWPGRPGYGWTGAPPPFGAYYRRW